MRQATRKADSLVEEAGISRDYEIPIVSLHALPQICIRNRVSRLTPPDFLEFFVEQLFAKCIKGYQHH